MRELSEWRVSWGERPIIGPVDGVGKGGLAVLGAGTGAERLLEERGVVSAEPPGFPLRIHCSFDQGVGRFAPAERVALGARFPGAECEHARTQISTAPGSLP